MRPIRRISISALLRRLLGKAATAELLRAESEERFRMLVEFAPDSIVVHRALRILYINPAGAAMLGAATPEELEGRHLLDFTHPEYHETVEQRMGELTKPGETVPLIRQKLRRPDGREVDIEVASAAVVYRGEPAVLTVARDITTQRQLEEELRQAQKMEAIGQLTSGIAHDFKNILSVILTTAEFLRESVERVDTEARAGIEDVENAARRGAEMIRRLMAFSRRAELQPVAVDLLTVVRESHSWIERVMPPSIRLQLALDDGVRPVLADGAAVEQILLNLVTNARDAMPDGGELTVAVRSVRFDAAQPAASGSIGPGEYACVTVSDTGTGMDEATRAQIFEPFFTTKERGKGTGLGMSMVQGLVVQLGGAVRVESEPGRGTTISVFFPLLEERPERRGPRATRAITLDRLKKTGLPGGTETVLVVEDEDALRRASQRVLEKLGYRVLTARDGEDGLDVLRDRKDEIALVISDTFMPKLDGFALLEAVRREAPGMRFLFASGHSPHDAGRDDPYADVPFIAKPWTFEEFAVMVRQVLDEPE